MSRALFFLILMMFASCATWKPSLYAPKDKSGYGYKIDLHPIQKRFLVSSYEGNADTRPLAASIYASIAASEYCHNKGQIAVVTLPEDYSKYSTYNQLGSYQVNKQTHYYTTPVTKTYPKFVSSFVCLDSARSFKGVEAMKTISAEVLGKHSPDFRGAVLVEKVSTEVASKLQRDDVILSIDGQRVEEDIDVPFILSKTKASSSTLKILRNKKPLTLKTEIFDNSKHISAYDRGLVDRFCQHLKDWERPTYCQVNAAAMK